MSTTEITAWVPPPFPATTAIPGQTGVRASDEEREATVARLHAAVGEGRLQLFESDERVAAAYAATYRHELPALLADLPRADNRLGRLRDGAPNWTDVWTAMVWRARLVLLGEGAAPPTAAHNRTAAVVAALTVLWLVLCAFARAGLFA